MIQSPRARLLVIVLVLALGGAACASSRDAGAAESPGTARVVEGKATLTRNSKSRALAAEQTLRAGDLIAVDGAGSVLIDLAGGRSFELASGKLEVLSAERVDIADGSLLATLRSPVQVRMAGTRAVFQTGTVRFDAAQSPRRIAAYEVDGLRVKSGTQDLEVPRYWQVSLGADESLGEAKPIQFSASDNWDRTYLAKALEVDNSIANLVRGLEAQLRGAAPGYLTERLSMAGIGAEAFQPFAQTQPSAQILALTLAQEWKKESPPEVEKAFSQALALYTVGATWGLLAQQFDVDRTAFVNRLQTEINSILSPAAQPGGAGNPGGGLIPRRGGGTVALPVQPSRPVPGQIPVPGQPAPSPTPSPGSLIPLLPDPLRSIVDELYGIVGDLLPIIGPRQQQDP